MEKKVPIEISEAMVERYASLHAQAKEIDKELTRLKQIFNDYFDSTTGTNQNGEQRFERYLLKRQVRVSEKLKKETVDKLEEMQLVDFIIVEKKPDEKKINAAIELGFISPEELEEYRERRYSTAIYVKEI